MAVDVPRSLKEALHGHGEVKVGVNVNVSVMMVKVKVRTMLNAMARVGVR